MLVWFSSPSVWEVALPEVSGCCKLGNAVGSCSRHPEPSRERERGWGLGLQTRSQLILINRAANCGLAESGEGGRKAPTALPGPAWSLFLVSGRFHRGAREEILLRVCHGGAVPGVGRGTQESQVGMSPRSQGRAGGSGPFSGIRNWEGSACLLPDQLPSSSK